MKASLIKLLRIIIIILNLNTSYINGKIPKVAIIGGNIDGALCAYYLHELIDYAHIDIYEHVNDNNMIQNDQVIRYHPKQGYINQLIMTNNLKSGPLYDIGIPIIYIKNGESYPYNRKELRSKSPKAYDSLKDLLNKFLNKLKNVYELQAEEKMQFFESSFDLIRAINKDFGKYVQINTLKILEENLILKDDVNIRKYVESAVLKSYIQNLNTHAFAGLWALIFETDILGDMRKITDDLQDVVSKLLSNKIKNYFTRKVIKITRKNGQNFVKSKRNKIFNKTIAYDFIIIATNNNIDEIKFNKFKNVPKFPEYLRYWSTVLIGSLMMTIFDNPKYIGLNRFIPAIYDISSLQIIQSINNNNDDQSNYLKNLNVIVKNSNDRIWSMISEKKVENSDPYVFFQRYKFLDYIPVKMFPNYDVSKISFQQANYDLGENIYNVKAGDLVAISKEMMAISAKNVAILIKNKKNMENQRNKISHISF